MRERKRTTHDAQLVGVLLAHGAGVLADERALRVEDERQGRVLLLGAARQPRQALREVQAVGSPGTCEEYEVVELHALYVCGNECASRRDGLGKERTQPRTGIHFRLFLSTMNTSL